MAIKPPLWLFLLALATSWLIIGMAGFDGLYGQDSFHYLDCSRRVLTAPLQALQPGNCYWPVGYPALEALFIRLTGTAPFGAQLASTLTAAALAPLTYWMALESRLAGEQSRVQTGIAAGLITALCGQVLLSSIVVMSDAAALFWATLSACLLLRWARGDAQDRCHILWLVGSAATLAIAAITRWIYAGLLLPFGVFATVSVYRRQVVSFESTPGVPRAALAARVIPPLLLAAATFCLIFLPELHVSQRSESPALSHGWLVGWNPLNALRTSFDTADGHQHYRLPPAIVYAFPLVHPLYLSPLLTPFVFFGAWKSRHSRALLLLGGWILTLYLYLSGVPFENTRFPLAFFPPVAVLAAVGLWQLALALRLRPTRVWLLLLVALGTAAPFSYRAISGLVRAKGGEVSAMRYLQAHVPADAVVVTFGLSATLKQYTRADVTDLFAQTPDTLRPIVCSGRRAYLYVERGNIESQWPGKSPAINVHWLQDAIGMQALGSQDTWTLYRVRSCNS